MGDVTQWPKSAGILAETPKRFDKAADHGLFVAVRQLESQWGTVEAHNRLAEWCAILRQKVEAGKAETPNPNCVNEFRRPVHDYWKW